MEIYNDQKGARDLGYKGLSDARSEPDGKNNLDHFNPVVSALKSLAKKATTNPLIAPQIFAFAGEKGSRRYGLGVSPDNITIID